MLMRIKITEVTKNWLVVIISNKYRYTYIIVYTKKSFKLLVENGY